jgi:hypothetical protein
MNNNIKWDKVIKRLNIWLMLLTVVMLGFTTLLFETFEMFEIDELDEVHEFCGYTFFSLIAIHLILFRKGLIRVLTFKTK